jgi:hypothetical protein
MQPRLQPVAKHVAPQPQKEAGQFVSERIADAAGIDDPEPRHGGQQGPKHVRGDVAPSRRPLGRCSSTRNRDAPPTRMTTAAPQARRSRAISRSSAMSRRRRGCGRGRPAARPAPRTPPRRWRAPTARSEADRSEENPAPPRHSADNGATASRPRWRAGAPSRPETRAARMQDEQPRHPHMAPAHGADLLAPVDLLPVAAPERGVEARHAGQPASRHRHAEPDPGRRRRQVGGRPRVRATPSIRSAIAPVIATDCPASGALKISAVLENGVAEATADRTEGASRRSAQPGGTCASEFRSTTWPLPVLRRREAAIDRADEPDVLRQRHECRPPLPRRHPAASNAATRGRWRRRPRGSCASRRWCSASPGPAPRAAGRSRCEPA